VAIRNVSALGAKGVTTDGSTFANGHRFDFVITTKYQGGTNGRSDSVLEWWEKINLPAQPGHPPDTWTDVFALAPTSSTFKNWKNRTIPCPGGGGLTVTIVDMPCLGAAPGTTQTRTLDFRLVVKSGAGCGCSNPSMQVLARQVLVMINGKLDLAASTMTVVP